MSFFLKTLSSFLILFLAITIDRFFSYLHPPVLLIFFFTLIFSIPITAREIFSRNRVILPFIVFYLGFGTLSVRYGGGELSRVALTSLKILLVFNIVSIYLRWVGINGMMRFLSLLPSERLRLYLLLVMKGIHLFRRNSDMTVMQIKSRLVHDGMGRRRIAGYYVRNMIFRELYSLHYLQAALYTRVPDRIEFFMKTEKTGIIEVVNFAAALISVVLLFAGNAG